MVDLVARSSMRSISSKPNNSGLEKAVIRVIILFQVPFCRPLVRYGYGRQLLAGTHYGIPLIDIWGENGAPSIECGIFERSWYDYCFKRNNVVAFRPFRNSAKFGSENKMIW